MSVLLKIKENLKIIILTILFVYILINLFGGQRGLFAYFEKKEVLENLKIQEKETLEKIKNIELKNTLLSERLDYDYIDMLIRDKLMLGKKGETTYIVIDNEDISTARDTAKNIAFDQALESLNDVIWSVETFDITTIRASTGQYLVSKYINI